MKPEQKFYQWIKSHTTGMVIRIETTVAIGIPDLVICLNGQTHWVELKAGPPLLRPHQYAWMVRAHRAADIRTFVIAHELDQDLVRAWCVPFDVEPYGEKYALIRSRPIYERPRISPERFPVNDILQFTS